MLNACKIWILLSLAIMMLFAGCSDDVLREDLPEEEKPAGNVYIRLQMNLNSNGPAGSRAASRAGEGSTDPETPGKGNENAVNTVDILVFDATTNELTDIVFIDKTQISQIIKPNKLVVPIFAKQGQTVKIYAAVNMTAAMRQFFTLGSTGTDFSLSSTGNSYWDVINEFVPGSNGKQATLEANANGCIPMTGQFKVESLSDGDTDNTIGNGDITIKGHTTKNNPLSVKADVSRIVAKVHVLAKSIPFKISSGEEVEYAIASSTTPTEQELTDKDYSKWIGWIRLDNVRYILNGTNKSTYIFPQAKDTEGQYPWMDRNMDLTPYRNGRMFSNYENDFMFYDGMSLHRENISPTSHFAQAEKYVEENTWNNTVNGSDNTDRYTAGLYCLENYFDTPAANSDDDNFYATRVDAIPMITHLSIAAKLTPRSIVVRKDYKERMDKFVKAYEDDPDDFRKQYGLTAEDFKNSDKDRWKTIKKLYFGTVSETYRIDFCIIKTESEADAADLINWSLMINNLWSGDDADFENGKYPASTFYVYDTHYDGEQAAETTWNQRYLYLTAGAVNAATDENIKIKTYSVPHIGGWGYYYTYLDQLKQTDNGKTPYTASQVTRNTYYLVTVGNFGFPGGTVTRPEYIKVNTVPVGWDYSGKGDINLH